MNQQPLQNIMGSCLSGAAPPCSCACPFHLDIRSLIEKITAGSFTAAYKILAKSTVLPGIVSHLCDEPCQEHCTCVGGSISLRALEVACFQLGATSFPTFYIPPKNKQILIIGGGACGLTCALKLAQRGYDVHLIEKEAQLGGRLRLFDPQVLPVDVLTADLRLMKHPKITITLGHEVQSLGDFQFDAALIATGEGGRQFGAVETAEDSTLHRNLLLSGSVLGGKRGPINSIRMGIDASYMIESAIKVGRFIAPEIKRQCGFFPSTALHQTRTHVISKKLAAWTMDDIIQEAGRCPRCSCRECMDVCDMLKWFQKDPKPLLSAVAATVEKTQLNRKTALREILSCSQCGLCEKSCPAGLDLKRVFVEARQAMQQSHQLPDAVYDFWICDMEHGCGEAAVFQMPKSDGINYLYFPGCQMGASDPGCVMESYHWLCKQFPGELAILLSCCGAPAHWAGRQELHAQILESIRRYWKAANKPTVILPCPTCTEMFHRFLPDLETISLWELMEKYFCAPRPSNGETVSIFDPCASRNDAAAQESIRSLVKNAGYQIDELPASGKNARCCGYGGLVYSCNPGLTRQIASQNTTMSEHPYVTYCTNCRDSFLLQKKKTLYILDVLFPRISAYPADPPSLTKRRENRIQLKRELLMESGENWQAETAPHQSIQLEISVALRNKMNKELILEDHVKKAVYFGEATGSGVFDTADGTYTCHLTQGALTFWVKYNTAPSGQVIVNNVYKHRMQIVE